VTADQISACSGRSMSADEVVRCRASIYHTNRYLNSSYERLKKAEVPSTFRWISSGMHRSKHNRPLWFSYEFKQDGQLPQTRRARQHLRQKKIGQVWGSGRACENFPLI